MNILMSEQIGSLSAALSKAQLAIENVSKDKQAYGYKYADLASCLQATKKPLGENGLSVSQLITSDGDKHFLTTLLMHESGQWLKSTFCIENVVMKQCNSLQQIGAGITYARRYAFCSMVGLTQEDDDGNIPTKNEAVKAKAGTKISSRVDELVTLCKTNNLDVKEFAKFNGIDSKDINTVDNAIAYFEELKKRFIEHKENIAEHILSAKDPMIGAD